MSLVNFHSQATASPTQVVPVFAGGLDFSSPVKKFFYDPLGSGRSYVDTVVSLTGFALVGGQRHMVGGWGFQLGDHGSGAWVGHHAVRRAALALDGLLQPTRLITDVLARTGGNRLDLSRWSEQAKPKDYAQFAPLVFECAAQGDVQGMMIVIEGASAISNLGRALLARGAKAICLLGGLAKAYPPYLDADVKQALAEPGADAVDGAIMMARRAQGLAERWS